MYKPKSYRQSLRERNAVLVGCVLPLVITAVIVGAIARYDVFLVNRAAQYEQAPGCIAGAVVVSHDLPPCTFVPMTITAVTRRSRGGGRHGGGYHDTVLIGQSSDGTAHSVELFGSLADSVVHPGDAANVEYWRGAPAQASVHRYWYKSVDDPNLVASMNSGDAVIAIVPTLIVVTLVCGFIQRAMTKEP